ncbi:hypothetical protein EDM59_29860, partial [Brevibacillus nitrificans]
MSLKRKLSAFAVLSSVALNAFVGQAFAAINVNDSTVSNVTVNTTTNIHFGPGTSVTNQFTANAAVTVSADDASKETALSGAKILLQPTGANIPINLGGLTTSNVIVGNENVDLNGNENSIVFVKPELLSKINEAELLDEADYTADSWAALQTALTAAIGLVGDENATATELTGALNNLKTAINNLIDPSVPALEAAQ